MNIKYSSQAEKFLKKSHESERIIAKIEALRKEPFPQDMKVIASKERTYRIRVGKYRVLYAVSQNTIIVAEIKKRSRAY